MTQSHDLTAERAAQLVEAMLVFIEKTSRRKLSFSAIVDMNTGTTENPQDRLVAAVIKHDKQTRQAALREASQVVRNRALLWRSHGGAKVGFPYGHLTIEGEYESMADELDRLASEGAPAPIDLLPKLNDDGGYGEHF